ncbi:hypothetical protein SP21_29 [Salmonella phage 21]|nr:hypothetical protein SP21_29 [Salmonella phage 21]
MVQSQTLTAYPRWLDWYRAFREKILIENLETRLVLPKT